MGKLGGGSGGGGGGYGGGGYPQTVVYQQAPPKKSGGMGMGGVALGGECSIILFSKVLEAKFLFQSQLVLAFWGVYLSQMLLTVSGYQLTVIFFFWRINSPSLDFGDNDYGGDDFGGGDW